MKSLKEFKCKTCLSYFILLECKYMKNLNKRKDVRLIGCAKTFGNILIYIFINAFMSIMLSFYQ